MAMPRRILHLDIDAFLASVEQVVEPRLRGLPVAVGSGVVASCSLEAKSLGVRTAMAMSRARQICPALLVLPGDAARAARFRDGVERILRRHAPVVERSSLDDFYADLTGLPDPPAAVARSLRAAVAAATGLSVAQGIGATRTVARLATDRAKPGGIHAVPPGREEAFLGAHPVGRLPGVGRRTAELFARLGVRTVADLRGLGMEVLADLLGRRGEKLWRAATARDLDPLRPAHAPRQVSRETSFGEPTGDPDLVEGLVAWLLDRALAALRAGGLRARRLEVVLRFADNRFAALGARLEPPADAFAMVAPRARELLRRAWSRRLLLRGLGVRLGNLVPAGGVQDGLWDPVPGRSHRLEAALARIRGKHGFGLVLRGRESLLLGRLPRGREGFRLRTPSLSQ
jgi:DNA polymerase-4